MLPIIERMFKGMVDHVIALVSKPEKVLLKIPISYIPQKITAKFTHSNL